jgi:hypothetical protein
MIYNKNLTACVITYMPYKQGYFLLERTGMLYPVTLYEREEFSVISQIHKNKNLGITKNVIGRNYAQVLDFCHDFKLPLEKYVADVC